MSKKGFQIAVVIMLAFLCVMSALCNVQVFLSAETNSTITGDRYETLVPAEDADNTAEYVLGHRKTPTAFDVRDFAMIDQLANPTLWSGSDIDKDFSDALKVVSNGESAEAYRKYDGFLNLNNYIRLTINAADIENFEWAALFLLEDLSYANYFEYSLLPALKEGENTVVINRKDVIVGTGKPVWDEISTVKIGFKAKENTGCAVTVREIATYNASAICSVWFDDGWKSTYDAAFPLMESRGIKGTLSVISSHVGYDDFCSQAELNKMYAAGWDMVNHTQNHADLTKVSSENAVKEITACSEYLTASGFERAKNVLVPPYCATNAKTDEAIASAAEFSRPRWNTFNMLPLQDHMNIGFREVTPDVTPEEVCEWIDTAIEYDLWLILLFHSIVDSSGDATEYPKDGFERIIQYLHQHQGQCPSVTVSEALRRNDATDEAIAENAESAEPKSGGNKWRLVWEDDFNGEKLDGNVWNIVSSPPFKNNELQTYQAENVEVENGVLKLIARKNQNEYTSGAVTTENKKLFSSGRLEIRAKLPGGKGVFPAVWMLPQSGAQYPEVDIIEFLGSKPKEIWHVMHYSSEGERECAYEKVTGGDYSNDFHVYEVEWAGGQIIWRIDGELTFAATGYVPAEKLFLYLNVAVGGNWPGSPDESTAFPCEMQIDYVRCYAKDRF